MNRPETLCFREPHAKHRLPPSHLSETMPGKNKPKLASAGCGALPRLRGRPVGTTAPPLLYKNRTAASAPVQAAQPKDPEVRAQLLLPPAEYFPGHHAETSQRPSLEPFPRNH